MTTDNIISISFMFLVIYLITNTTFFIIYKNNLKKDLDFYNYFYYYYISNNKLLYFFCAIYTIKHHMSHKDEIKIDYYEYQIRVLTNDIPNYTARTYYDEEVNRIKKLIHQTKLRIKIKKLKGVSTDE